MAFEYDWIRSFATLKIELVYFFYYAVVVALFGAGRTNSGIRGLSKIRGQSKRDTVADMQRSAYLRPYLFRTGDA